MKRYNLGDVWTSRGDVVEGMDEAEDGKYILYAEVAKIKADAVKASKLLLDTVQSHADPESHLYNDCDDSEQECVWCIEAKQVIASLDKLEEK